MSFQPNEVTSSLQQQQQLLQRQQSRDADNLAMFGNMYMSPQRRSSLLSVSGLFDMPLTPMAAARLGGGCGPGDHPYLQQSPHRNLQNYPASNQQHQASGPGAGVAVNMGMLPSSLGGGVGLETDPFAPLSIHETAGAVPLARRFSGISMGDHSQRPVPAPFGTLLNDRSESSVLSLMSTSGRGSSSRFFHGAYQSPLSTTRLGLGQTLSGFKPIPQLANISPEQSPTAVSSFPNNQQNQPLRQVVSKPPLVAAVATSSTAATIPCPPKSVKSTANADDANTACGDEDDEDDDASGGDPQRFKKFHEEKWTLRYNELLQFLKENGHAGVPHTYPKNQQLARWVKRQRRQYKLKKDNKQSTMTAERLELLDNAGFIWDSHDVNWREKLDSLIQFRSETGHCNVPSNYSDKKLATWVKCQRRQYKLHCARKPSAMTTERIRELERIGFEWEIRSTSRRLTPVPAANSLPAAETESFKNSLTR